MNLLIANVSRGNIYCDISGKSFSFSHKILQQSARALAFSYSATLTEFFPCFCLSCKANAKVKLADWAQPALFQISCYLCCSVVICFVIYIACV